MEYDAMLPKHDLLKSVDELVRVSKNYHAIAILRHAEREDIWRPEDSHKALLTEKGKKDAEELGRHLSPIKRIDFYHSPVQRCIETVDHIVKGYGGEYKIMGSNTYSGAPYIKDGEKFNELMFRKTGPGFINEWISNKISPEIILPLDESFYMMVRGLKSINCCKKGVVDMHITHDINIALFIVKIFNIKNMDGFKWPNFLEMIILYYDDENTWVYGRGKSIKIEGG